MLTREEELFYNICWQQLDPEGHGFAQGVQAIPFLKRSGLQSTVLKEIWVLSTPPNTNVIQKEEFFKALRYISLAQNGLPLDSQNLVGVARIDGIAPPPVSQPTAQLQTQEIRIPSNNVYELPQDQYQKYEIYFQKQPLTPQGYVTAAEAKSLFQKSQLPQQSLVEIWKLTDTGHKGYLFKNEFIVAMHLISLARKGIAVPPVLPDQLNQLVLQAAPSRPLPQQFLTQPSLSQPIQQPQIYQEIAPLPQPSYQELNQLNSRIQQQQQQIESTVSQISRHSSNQDHYKQLLDEKRKEIEFLDSTMNKLQGVLASIQKEKEEFDRQYKILAEQAQQKQQQISQINNNINDQVANLRIRSQDVMPQQTQPFQTQAQPFQQPPVPFQQPPAQFQIPFQPPNQQFNQQPPPPVQQPIFPPQQTYYQEPDLDDNLERYRLRNQSQTQQKDSEANIPW
ncbi:hypothetical protein pb186bvf_006811 [Paramecium bursaria]